MKVNKEIRAPRVRVIGSNGEQIGIITRDEALYKAEEEGLDLVEIVPTADPPVCKIINRGKFQYDQTKREKESKKAQHQVKVKEIKVKPNIDTHDIETKLRQAREFLTKGNKVKLTCTFRGREMAHPEIGDKIVKQFCADLDDISMVESPAKMMGRAMIVVLAPSTKKKKEASKVAQMPGEANQDNGP